jgi:hypothetical protein
LCKNPFTLSIILTERGNDRRAAIDEGTINPTVKRIRGNEYPKINAEELSLGVLSNQARHKSPMKEISAKPIRHTQGSFLAAISSLEI